MLKSIFFVGFPKICEANILGAITTASCLFTTTTITVKNYLVSCQLMKCEVFYKRKNLYL